MPQDPQRVAVDRQSLLPRIWPLSRRFCAMSVSGHTNLEACSPKSCVSGVSRWSLDVLPSRHSRATLATGGSSRSGQCVYSLPGLLLARLVPLRWPRLPPTSIKVSWAAFRRRERLRARGRGKAKYQRDVG